MLNLSCFCVLWALINQLSKFGNEEVSGYDYLDIIKEDLMVMVKAIRDEIYKLHQGD